MLKGAAGLFFNSATPGPIGGTTPSTGAFTTLSSSGLYTPTGGIKGVSAATNATAGNVGEIITSGLIALTNFPTSTQWGDLGSIILTAGDWDVSVICKASANGATVVAWSAGIGTVTGNSATGLSDGDNAIFSSIPPTSIYDIPITIPSWRVSIAGSTTYYLKIKAQYSVATAQASGRISARRGQPGA